MMLLQSFRRYISFLFLHPYKVFLNNLYRLYLIGNFVIRGEAGVHERRKDDRKQSDVTQKEDFSLIEVGRISEPSIMSIIRPYKRRNNGTYKT